MGKDPVRAFSPKSSVSKCVRPAISLGILPVSPASAQFTAVTMVPLTQVMPVQSQVFTAVPVTRGGPPFVARSKTETTYCCKTVVAADEVEERPPPWDDEKNDDATHKAAWPCTVEASCNTARGVTPAKMGSKVARVVVGAMDGAAVSATVGANVGPVGKRVGLAVVVVVVGASLLVSAKVGNAVGDWVLVANVGVPVATGGGTLPALVGGIGVEEIVLEVVAEMVTDGGTTVVAGVSSWVGNVGARGVSTAAAVSVDPWPVVTATTIPTKAANTKRSDPIKMDRVEPQTIP